MRQWRVNYKQVSAGRPNSLSVSSRGGSVVLGSDDPPSARSGGGGGSSGGGGSLGGVRFLRSRLDRPVEHVVVLERLSHKQVSEQLSEVRVVGL